MRLMEYTEEENLYAMLTVCAISLISLHLMSLTFTSWFVLSYYYHVGVLDRFGMMLLPVWGMCCMLLPVMVFRAWYLWFRDRLSPKHLPVLAAFSIPAFCYSIPAFWLLRSIVMEALKLTA